VKDYKDIGLDLGCPLKYTGCGIPCFTIAPMVGQLQCAGCLQVSSSVGVNSNALILALVKCSLTLPITLETNVIGPAQCVQDLQLLPDSCQ